MSNYKHERQKPRKDAEHYVNNKEFYEAMKAYWHIANTPWLKNREIIAENKKRKKENKKLKKEGKELLEYLPLGPMPQIPDEIGICIQKIANKLANRPNFSKYIFRDEMIADAIENCLTYINNFNPEKSTNPFGYFTQISWFAFIRRIEKEKGYLYTKYKMIDNHMVHELSEEDHDLYIQKYGSDYMDANMHEFIHKYEDKKKSKSKKKVKENTDLEIDLED